jgi:hypothetical protein
VIKVSHFLGEDQFGPRVIPLFGPADSYFEKTAAAQLLPPVVQYIENLNPSNSSSYVLVNAMGATEFYGSNINGDAFTEVSLIHRPDDWRDDPVIDKIKGKEWPYGFPTFYDAHPFAHHRNKDPKRAFGEVELAAWNDHMHRVELVCRVDKDKCEEFGGVPVWDRIKAGQFPDVSMGCKVPFDTCSICLDWKLYHEAQATFDPKKHKHPGQAILEFHKKLKEKNGKGIRGLSITRADYCEHAAKQMSRIFADGRKVWVYNDYPRFFDISFVFIGADKTAKMMLKIAEGGVVYSILSAKIAEDMGYMDLWHPESSTREQLEKAASAEDMWFKMAFLGKSAKFKESEIIKDVVPDQFKGKAIALATGSEKDLPKDLLDDMASGSPLEKILSTTGGLGMVLRPREFQRVVLVQIGRKDLADDFEKKNITFPKTDEKTHMPMGPEFFSKMLAALLKPFFEGRSALGPALEHRLVMSSPKNDEDKKTKTSSQDLVLLHKIGSAYNGYRDSLMDLVAHAQPLITDATDPSDDLRKVAAAPADDVFTPLAVTYLQDAFWNEVSVSGNDEAP